MRKLQVFKLFFFFTVLSLFFVSSSYKIDTRAFCGNALYIKNSSSSRSITYLHLSHGTGTASVTVTIPPGGTYGPAFVNFATPATLYMTITGTGPGRVEIHYNSLAGEMRGCNSFNGSTANVSWTVGCGNYYANFIDNGGCD